MSNFTGVLCEKSSDVIMRNYFGRVGRVLAGCLTITLRENTLNVCLRLPAEMTYLRYKLSLFLRKV